MLTKHSLIYLFILLAFASCKTKEEPDEQSIVPPPVFTSSGTVDGRPMELAAGKNNYYMSGDFTLNTNNVYECKGELKQLNCTTCGPSLGVIINSNEAGTAFNADAAFSINDYPFFDQSNPIRQYYKVAFHSVSSGNGTHTPTWDLGNGQQATTEDVSTVYPSSGAYDVSLTSSFSGGCSSTLSQPVYLYPPIVGKNPDFNINYLDSGQIMFNSIPVEGVTDVSWDFGDAQTGSGSIVTHDYANSGLYKVCMSYMRNNDTLRFCKNINTIDFTGCKSNFEYASEYHLDSLNLSTVTVEWTDETGHAFSSKNIRQDASALFRILESSNYKINEKGLKTRQLKIRFTCKVSDGSRVIEMDNINATIAVAYP